MTIRTPADRHRRLWRTFWLLALIYAVVPATIFLRVPEWRTGLIAEDKALESMTAAFFVVAFLLGSIAALRPTSRKGMPWTAAGIPLLGLMGFLDETSFCGLLAGADNPGSSGATEAASPLVLSGYTIDGVHDVLAVGFKILRDHGDLTTYIIGSIVLGLAISLPIILRRRYMPWVVKWMRVYPAFNYLRFAVIFIGVAMLIDLDLIKGDIGKFIEETLEMLGGLALAFAGAAMCRGPLPVDSHPATPATDPVTETPPCVR